MIRCFCVGDRNFSLLGDKDRFHCANDKAVKLMRELDSDKGIGLIESVRQGLGKPNIIYVKNFVGSSQV